MRPSPLFFLLSVFTSLVSASKGSKGYQTVGIYYAYKLEWLAQNKDPTYVHALAASCYGKSDCSTFAGFLKAILKDDEYDNAQETGIFDSDGPFNTDNPGDEAAKAYNLNSGLSGQYDNKKIFGDGVKITKYSEMVMRVADAADRARISLGSAGQDTVNKIAHHFEEVVKARKAELSPDKVTDIIKNNPKYNFKIKADSPNEIDWDATYKANPDLLKDDPTKRRLLKSYNNFDRKILPTHEAAIKAATSFVNQLMSPPSCG
ncbi:hypothetical protein KCU77_g399, partial [Aureobasidium melanogenum]